MPCQSGQVWPGHLVMHSSLKKKNEHCCEKFKWREGSSRPPKLSAKQKIVSRLNYCFEDYMSTKFQEKVILLSKGCTSSFWSWERIDIENTKYSKFQRRFKSGEQWSGNHNGLKHLCLVVNLYLAIIEYQITINYFFKKILELQMFQELGVHLKYTN